ncbi:MAG: mandelate racemase/muconate lactonizing enzyme family protein [Firmicutes bacterium]|nr:mandelate racemase/muconate lactonizing enzyme family protein [Bacillota bacterium]
MKIVDCKLYFLTYEYTEKERWHWSGGTANGCSTCLVQVITDEGITGLGEIGGGTHAPKVTAALVEYLAEIIRDQDPTNIESLWNKMYKAAIVIGRRGIVVACIGAIEIALWDIFGKATNQPVYKLLGGKVHDRLKVYASKGVDANRPLSEEAEEVLSQGFSAYKVRIGYPSLAQNVKIISEIRERIGDRLDLMADAGQGYVPKPWSVPEAVKIAKELEQYNLFWLEEPCLTDNLLAYSTIREQTTIPIAGGENGCTRWEFQQIFDTFAMDIIQPDVTFVGGITECKKIAATAEMRGIPIANHIWGSAVSVAANLHVMFSCSNALIVEYQLIPNVFREILFIEKPKIIDGYIDLPEVPGLGVELTTSILEKYQAKSKLYGQILTIRG